MVPGESGKLVELRELKSPFRAGMDTPRELIIGEESGEDCSARVEWCRFVQALEKSNPRDRRGRTEEEDVKDAEESSLGESGSGLVKLAMLVLLMSLCGICKLKP